MLVVLWAPTQSEKQTRVETIHPKVDFPGVRVGPNGCVGLTLEIFGILLGSIVLLFLVMGTVFQVSSLCMRCSRASGKEKSRRCVRKEKRPRQTSESPAGCVVPDSCWHH